ncbi:LysR family transcriptional regulator [Paraliomyxa miuraensis]|uniref:LysR family transcriptional regulator n=1 Tax=Paraliomyxa miuraensis TaxID=376150 RepID=UPI0022567B0A|nr:LysR family transcriptional regulator [Paraliomyxa miuraensis]MCX4241683.1 LysR family transcriptional regulator [Paraliomyxa miuraensis]
MLPDWNRLRVLFHVVRSGSVSAAARELHVTQSAVSQSLAKLEAEVGAQLFVRRPRRLVPTPAGTRLFGVVAPFVEALEGGVEEIHRAHHELSGVVRLGAPVEFGTHRLPPLLAAFRHEHPGIRFELTLGHPSLLLPRLDEGRLELAFVDVFDAPGSRPSTAGLEVVEVLEERLVLVGSRAYEAEHLAGSRAQRRLEAASFVAYQPAAPEIRGWFRHHFDRVPARLEIALAVESVQAVIEAVRLGMGLGVVPSHTVSADLDTGALVAITTRRRAIRSRVTLVRLLDKVPSRAEKAFVRALGRSRGSGAT